MVLHQHYYSLLLRCISIVFTKYAGSFKCFIYFLKERTHWILCFIYLVSNNLYSNPYARMNALILFLNTNRKKTIFFNTTGNIVQFNCTLSRISAVLFTITLGFVTASAHISLAAVVATHQPSFVE